jgi:hypothetical protein
MMKIVKQPQFRKYLIVFIIWCITFVLLHIFLQTKYQQISIALLISRTTSVPSHFLKINKVKQM